LPALGTVADTVAGEDFPTFIAEAGIRGERASVRVRSSQGVKGVFVGEDAPEQSCGDPSVDEVMGGGDEVVVVGVEALLEFLGLCREFLLGGCPGAIPGDVG